MKKQKPKLSRPVRKSGVVCKCLNCNKVIVADNEGDFHAVRIQRGWFRAVFDEEECFEINEDVSNIKCECWVCVECYLKDADLCNFFAKNKMVIR